MKKAREGFGSFDTKAGQAARTLLHSQGYDGGWGLTLTSVSSIVNTSEVLQVLRAVGVAGQPVRQALGFLTTAVPEHCRPRQKGGRGEHTRFVAFGLTGLLAHPRFFHHDGVAEAVSWCADWLEDHRVDHGWPEVLGLDDTSLHQTALALRALARLRDTLHEFGPGLPVAPGVDTTSLLKRTESMISHGVHGLLYHRRPSGAWGWRTYVDTEPSPSKTALCLLALSSVCSGTGADNTPTYPDEPQESGGVHGEVRLRRLPEVVTEARQWLLRNHHRWETFVEDDKDVQGTAWEHMAYALGAEAVVRAGSNPRDPRLSRAWRLMDELWDAEAGMWNEPGASGRRATVRAVYSTVCAYRAAIDRLARIGLDAPGGSDKVITAEIRITSVVLGAGGTIVLGVPDRESPVRCELSQRLFDLVKVLHDGPAGGLPTHRIAEALFVAPSSVPKYVQRLNQAVSTAFGDTPIRLCAATSADGIGRGYRLAGR